MRRSTHLARALALRSLVGAFIATAMVVGGMGVPASAVGTRTISGHVYLGSSASPATTGDAVVAFRRAAIGVYGSGDVVSLAVDGSFVIPELAAEQYELTVRYTGTAGYSTMIWPDVVPGAGPNFSFVNLSQVESAVADITLPAYAELSGHVSLGTAALSAGAGEVAVTYLPASVGYLPGPPSAPVLTDASGNYSFGGLPAGFYVLRFEYLGTGLFLSRDWSGGTRFVLGAAALQRDMVLPPTVSISDRVKLYDDDANNFTYAGAGAVKVTYAKQGGAVIGSVYTQAGGWYTIPGLDNLQYYTLTYSHQTDPGFPPSTVTANPGSSLIVSRLDRIYTVSGHVDILDSSRPATAGEVTVRFCFVDFVWHCMFTAQTDASGNYTVSGLAGHRYKIELDYNGSGDIPDQVAAVPDRMNGVPVWRPTPADSTLDLTLRYGNTVSGTVLDSASAPIPGSVLWVVEYDPTTGEELSETQAFPDSSGHYSVANLRDGLYGIEFRADGFSDQTWPGVSTHFYEPGTFVLGDGQTKDDADATMYRSGLIQGTVSAPGLSDSDIYYGQIVASLLRRDPDSGIYYFTGDQVTVPGTASYSFAGLWPDDYKIRVTYVGPAGVANRLSPVLLVGENQTKTFSPALSPAIPVENGDRVKVGTSMYLVNGFLDLVPLGSLASVTDAGLPGTYKTLTESAAQNYDVEVNPLSNVIVCFDNLYLAAEGKAWPIDEDLVDGLDWTFLEDSVCDLIPDGPAAIHDTLLLTSPAGPTYQISPDGEKHQILTTPTLGLLSAPADPRVYKVNDYFLSTVPTGARVLPPGGLVRAPNGSTYFVAGFDKLVPITSYDVTASMGISSTPFDVNAADIAQMSTIDSQQLKNTVVCPTQTYYAAEGKLWPIDAALVAGLSKTTLDAESCSVLPKSATAIHNALFLMSTAGGITYSVLADGAKRQVLTAETLTALASPYAPITLHVAPSTLNGMPTGTKLLGPGAIVKGPSAGSPMYFVAGFERLVPLPSFDVTTSMGVPASVIPVTQADIDQATVIDTAPLSNVVVCPTQTYLAADGKLWPIDAALVAGLPKTTLEAVVCSILPKSTTTVHGALFLMANTVGVTYSITAAGVKRQVLTVETMTALANPYAPITLHVPQSFLNTVVTGTKVLAPGAIVRAPGTASPMYFVAGFDHLVPLPSYEATSSMGVAATYIPVAQADIDQATVIDTAPLSNVVVCPTQTYLAAEGKLWPLDAALVAGLTQTLLDTSACGVLPKSPTTVRGALFVMASTGGVTYSVTATGVKRQVLTVETMTALAAPYPAITLHLGTTFLNSVATGTKILAPGGIVKGPSSSSPMYFVAGFNHLVPLSNYEATTSMGIGASYIPVAQADLDQATVIDTASLSNVVVCPSQTYVAAEGKLWPVDASLVAGVSRTTMDASACSVLQKSATTVHGALFLMANTGGITYSITAEGTKRQVLTVSTMTLLAAPSSAITLHVGTSFLNAIPTGTKMLAPGAILRGPAADAPMYFVAGFDRLVPLPTYDPIGSLGLSPSYIPVAQADLDAATTESSPLSNVLVCPTQTYLAAEGRAWPIDAPLVAGLPQTTLDAPACTVLPKSSTTIRGALFLMANAGGVTYAVTSAGLKRQVLTVQTMQLLASPYPALTLHVAQSYLNTIPTGTKVLAPGAIVRGPAAGAPMYFVAGFERLVPLPTFDPTNSMGVPASVIPVAQADLDASALDSAPLSNVVVCSTQRYLGADGKLWPVDAALVAGLPQTTLDASACTLLPKSTTAIHGALFVMATTGGVTYSIMSEGAKRQVMTVSTMTLLASPSAPITLHVAASYLNTLPTGLKVLPPGYLVRSTTLPAIYLVDGFARRVPVTNPAVIAAGGIDPTVFTVTQAEVDSLALDSPTATPLGTFVGCDSQHFQAGGGKYQYIASAGAAEVALDSSTCAQLKLVGRP